MALICNTCKYGSDEFESIRSTERMQNLEDKFKHIGWQCSIKKGKVCTSGENVEGEKHWQTR